MKKVLICLWMVGLLAATLTGCNSGLETEGSAEYSQQGTAASATEGTEPATAAGETGAFATESIPETAVPTSGHTAPTSGQTAPAPEPSAGTQPPSQAPEETVPFTEIPTQAAAEPTATADPSYDSDGDGYFDFDYH